MSSPAPRSRSKQRPFPAEAPKDKKVGRGRTDAEETPLAIRTTGVDLPDALDAYVRKKLGARLGRLAHHIERISVRFEDFNGPRGGIDTECRIQVVLPSLPTELAKERADSPRAAFDACGHTILRNVKKSLERHGYSIGHRTRRVRGERTGGAATGDVETAAGPASRGRTNATPVRKPAKRGAKRGRTSATPGIRARRESSAPQHRAEAAGARRAGKRGSRSARS